MQHKITIGIPIESYVITQLRKKIVRWNNLPVKWHKETNLHIGVVSIGWVEDADVQMIRENVSRVCENVDVFSVNFSCITAASKKIDRTNIADAQIIRVEGEDNESMRILHDQLLTALSISHVKKNKFKPYIALGRIRTHKWSVLETYPVFPEPFPIQMDVMSVAIMEDVNTDGSWHIEPLTLYELR